jgi:hypothetical protein
VSISDIASNPFNSLCKIRHGSLEIGSSDSHKSSF